MNPGMQLRIRERQMDAFKMAMSRFLPYYLNVDMQLPTEYSYHIDMFMDILSWDIDWKNITYTKADLDIKDIKLEFK